MKKITAFSGVLLAGAMLTGLATYPAQATEIVEQQGVTSADPEQGTYYKLPANDQFGIAPNGYKFDVASDGSATATRTDTGEVEKLPINAEDSNHKKVTLKYMLSEKGELLVDLVDPDAGEYGGSAKCALGTIGGAGLAGLASGLAGAAIAAPTVVGTVPVAIGSAAAGAVFGGMAGAAASCFD